jgi:hypothetical protein
MVLAKRLLNATIPTVAQSGFPEDAATLSLVDDMQTRMLEEAPFSVESPEYFRLMMRLREQPADRRRFLRRLVFTPGPGEWEAIRLPAPLFPLYRLVRLSRLAARFVRS